MNEIMRTDENIISTQKVYTNLKARLNYTPNMKILK